jgi:hypothetical protein
MTLKENEGQQQQKQIIESSSKNDDDDDDSQSRISQTDATEFDGRREQRKQVGTPSYKLGDKESRTIGRLRLAVFGALLLASIIVCVIIYSMTRKSETNEFEVQFRGAGERVTKAFDGIATDKWGALGALRVAAMSEAIDKKRPWPFVTLSSFERRAATAKRLSNSIDIALQPIVTEKNKEKWLRYVKREGPKWM